MKTLFSLRKKLGIEIYQEEFNEKYIITELFCLENNKYFKYSTQIIMAIPVVIVLISAIIIRLLELSKTTQITMIVTISVIALILFVHLVLKGLLYFPLDSNCINYIKYEYPDLFNHAKPCLKEPKKDIPIEDRLRCTNFFLEKINRKEITVREGVLYTLVASEFQFEPVNDSEYNLYNRLFEEKREKSINILLKALDSKLLPDLETVLLGATYMGQLLYEGIDFENIENNKDLFK